MQIRNISSRQGTENNTKEKGSFKGGRSFVRTLANPDALSSTILLESCVTGGRGINAYRRGGFPEFRERFTDDVVSAVFWMKGVDIFNKLGNKFGEHVLKLPTTEFDVGKDALRTPFKNLISELGESAANDAAAKSLEKKLAAFKFTKIILSTLLATGFVGFALPKINQAITRKLMHSKEEVPSIADAKKSAYELMDEYSFESFDKKFSNKNKADKNPSFKGISPNVMTTVAHYLENNKICKMLTCDTGILSGRVVTARNADEGREYFFRDATSCFFYFASTPLIYKALQKITSSSKITDIDPVAAKQVHNEMLNQLKNADGTFASMSVKDFAVKTFGILDDKAQTLLAKLPFNSDVISYSELKKYITDENLLKKAAEMAKLQPEQAGIGKVLTKQQVADVLKNGSINTPEFMQSMFKEKFGDALTNPYKYIPMKKITSFRDNIDKYGQAVMDAATKKNGGIIDKKLLDSLNKKNYIMSAGFRAVAMGISALALGVVIPKLQYAMTARRTGSDSAPGLREFDGEKTDKKDSQMKNSRKTESE